MDTFNKVTNAASKAIWGEGQSHEEPVSGKLGDVAAGEPYDAGNIGGKVHHQLSEQRTIYLLVLQSGILEPRSPD